MYIFLLILNDIQTLKIHNSILYKDVAKDLLEIEKQSIRGWCGDDRRDTAYFLHFYSNSEKKTRKQVLLDKRSATQESTHNPQLSRIYTINREPKASCDQKVHVVLESSRVSSCYRVKK